MVGAKVEVGGGYRTHSPLGLRGEGLPLVVTGGSDDNLVAVFVDGACGGGCELRLFLGLLLDLCDLLALLRGSTDFHTQDNVSDLRLGERRHVHTERGRGAEGRGGEGNEGGRGL